MEPAQLVNALIVHSNKQKDIQSSVLNGVGVRAAVRGYSDL